MEGEGPQQRRDQPQQEVFKPKRGGNKRGTDRRFSLKSKQYEENTLKKMEGEEVPKTLRVSIFSPSLLPSLAYAKSSSIAVPSPPPQPKLIGFCFFFTRTVRGKRTRCLSAPSTQDYSSSLWSGLQSCRSFRRVSRVDNNSKLFDHKAKRLEKEISHHTHTNSPPEPDKTKSTRVISIFKPLK